MDDSVRERLASVITGKAQDGEEYARLLVEHVEEFRAKKAEFFVNDVSLDVEHDLWRVTVERIA